MGFTPCGVQFCENGTFTVFIAGSEQVAISIPPQQQPPPINEWDTL
jgi:hypothetical protein